ncbi:hypothetical protein CR513_11692, partial [Mucuna pruriens]
MSQLQSAGSSNLPSQPIPNSKGNANVVKLRSGKELLQPTLQQPPREIEGVVSALTKNEELIAGATRALPRKCRDHGIFSVPCTIGDYTFANAMLDSGASINVMPASIYKSLNFGDLEPTRMTIQLANRSIVQPLGVLEDVLVQVNELIFPTDFYVLDMEDETSGKESTLILGRPFLMTARTKIDVHAGTLSMEFVDTLVQFNIFEAMKHPTEDHSLFGINAIEELVEEYFQLGNSSEDMKASIGSTDPINCLKGDCKEVQNLPNSKDNHDDVADLELEAELIELLNQVYNQEQPECTNRVEVEGPEIKSPSLAQLTTIFMAEIKMTKEGRVKEKIRVNSIEELDNKADMLAETVLANGDQTQVGAEITVSSGSDS